MSTRTTVSRILLLATIALLGGLPAPAWAQQFTGTLRGTVQDATHALLPGAQVSVIEIATNDSREIVTDAQGRWVLPNLKPGTYRVVVTLDGFKKAAVDQVKLDVQGDWEYRNLSPEAQTLTRWLALLEQATGVSLPTLRRR